MLPRSAASGRSAKWFTKGGNRFKMSYTNSMRNETPSNNPYVNNLVEMGYDRADCEMVASAGLDATYPRVIHGRTFDTKEQYDEELADYIAGL
jgi:hypothetical protein